MGEREQRVEYIIGSLSGTEERAGRIEEELDALERRLYDRIHDLHEGCGEIEAETLAIAEEDMREAARTFAGAQSRTKDKSAESAMAKGTYDRERARSSAADKDERGAAAWEDLGAAEGAYKAARAEAADLAAACRAAEERYRNAIAAYQAAEYAWSEEARTDLLLCRDAYMATGPIQDVVWDAKDACNELEETIRECEALRESGSELIIMDGRIYRIGQDPAEEELEDARRGGYAAEKAIGKAEDLCERACALDRRADALYEQADALWTARVKEAPGPALRLAEEAYKSAARDLKAAEKAIEIRDDDGNRLAWRDAEYIHDWAKGEYVYAAEQYAGALAEPEHEPDDMER